MGSYQIHLVQDNYNEKLKSYLPVSLKENQPSVSNFVEILNEVTFENEESFSLIRARCQLFITGRLQILLKDVKIVQLNSNSLRNKFDSLV